MLRWPVLLAGAFLLAGCTSAPTVVGECETASVEAEIEALVAESRLKVVEYTSVVCEGSWTYVLADVAAPGEEPIEDHFLMRRDGDIWVLKSPESSCVEDELPPSIREVACSAGA